jgi:hypothetical protein
MAKTGTDFDPPFYQDITLVDFHDIVDYLSWYRAGIGSAADGIGTDTYFARTHVLPRETGKVKGVRVNCLGDRVVRGLPLFQTVDVPRRHPLFYLEGDDPSSLTEQLGSSVRTLCVKKYTPDSAWKNNDQIPDRFDNPIFDILHLDLNPKSPDWGQRLTRRKGDVGSILIIGRDGKDLSVGEVEQLYRFGQDWALPRVRQCAGREGGLARRLAFLNQCTAEAFRQFLDRMEED